MTTGALLPPHRFKPEDRLRQRREFERVYAAAKKSWGPGFTVFVAPGESGWHRLGLAVGRRAGKAVLRNRIKRRLREAFRLHRCDWPGCYDIVVHGRAEVAEMPFAELTEALAKAVRSAATARPRPHRGPRGRKQERSR